MKVVTVLGARPQFIKAAALSRAIKSDTAFEEVIVHTGQHYDDNMSDIFFDQMGIPRPHFNLAVKSSRHGQMTGQMLEAVEAVILDEKPDVVLVYGDTNSTLAGALAARKLHIKVAHVEAGLRSFNMRMPEEVNRILTDRISDYLFCPSQDAVNNLVREGFRNYPCVIHDVGDIMKDVALYYRDKAVKPDVSLPGSFVLATLHRAENTNDKSRLIELWNTFDEISRIVPVVIPLHPRTRAMVTDLTAGRGNANFIVIDPVGYLQMVYLVQHCDLVITDSGGLQKEAYYFKKYCLTIREETEWTELVGRGYNMLVGSNASKIFGALHKFRSNPSKGFDDDLYGDGKTASRILAALKA
ncbi:MAG TPA: UDP-N-acetylglucosamine 2-epimerase (non-hydrolyzing) [Chryseosolibacter sp.]